MEAVTFLIAVLALVIAVLAYRRAGGTQDLRRQVESLSSATGSMTEKTREKTADVLQRVERLIRGKEKSSPEQEEGEDNPPPRA
ncbi:MAG: hypothetical protein HY575_08165 [candidate division NC10 bacterium]|nr:hypothetical protein [candidate division NC10 bacterium]